MYSNHKNSNSPSLGDGDSFNPQALQQQGRFLNERLRKMMTKKKSTSLVRYNISKNLLPNDDLGQNEFDNNVRIQQSLTKTPNKNTPNLSPSTLDLDSNVTQTLKRNNLDYRHTSTMPHVTVTSTIQDDVLYNDSNKENSSALLLEPIAKRQLLKDGTMKQNNLTDSSRLRQTTISFNLSGIRTSRCFDEKISESSKNSLGNTNKLVSPIDLSNSEGFFNGEKKSGFSKVSLNQNVVISDIWTYLQRKFRHFQPKCKISEIFTQKIGNERKLPFLCVIVAKINFLDSGSLAILFDSTGEIESEIHDLVLKNPDFVEGAAVVLKDVTVFRPHLNREGYASHSIIVVPRNIAAICLPSNLYRSGTSTTKESEVFSATRNTLPDQQNKDNLESVDDLLNVMHEIEEKQPEIKYCNPTGLDFRNVKQCIADCGFSDANSRLRIIEATHCSPNETDKITVSTLSLQKSEKKSDLSSLKDIPEKRNTTANAFNSQEWLETSNEDGDALFW